MAARYGAAVRVCAVDGGGGAGLVDDPGHARSAYGITEDALVLVRPDNYVGLIARATDHGAVAGHLDSAINVPLRLAAHPAVGID